MDSWIPDEVDMQPGFEVVATRLFLPPPSQSMGVEGHDFCDLSTLLIDIVLEQITEVFRYLVPKLNAHADIRNTAKECLQLRLGVVAIAVSREIGQDTLEFVPCGEGTIGPDHNVVAIGKIAERQELAHSRELHVFFVFRG